MKRKEVLEAAEKCVCGGREEDYGSPEKSFIAISKLWSAYMQSTGKAITFSAHDVAILMALLKIARISTGRTKDDNYVDLIGYAACAAEMVDEI